MAGVTLLLLVPDISVHGGVQSFMRRIWEVMLSLEDEGAKLALASVNDSPASLRGSLRLPRGVPAIAASGSHWVFIARVLMLPRSDIVISGHLGQAIVAWLLKVLGLTRRYVVVLHGLEAWRRVSLFKRLAARGADCVIATTRFTANRFASENGIDRTHLRVIPLCADESVVVEGGRENLQGAFRVLTVGRQSATEQYKGFDHLIDAVAVLLSTGRDITLHVVGEGDDQQRLRERARARGVLGRVHFHGHLDDPQLQSAYASCDIFALPSREEGFGIVYVEAMRHGKPCVGADSGGVPEVIDNGVCGLLVPYGNVPALAAAFERLYDDAELRLRFGEAGRRKAEAMFSRTAFGDACKQALQDVMRVSRAAR